MASGNKIHCEYSIYSFRNRLFFPSIFRLLLRFRSFALVNSCPIISLSPGNWCSSIGDDPVFSFRSMILRQPSWHASTGLSEAAQSASVTLEISLGLLMELTNSTWQEDGYVELHHGSEHAVKFRCEQFSPLLRPTHQRHHCKGPAISCCLVLVRTWVSESILCASAPLYKDESCFSSRRDVYVNAPRHMQDGKETHLETLAFRSHRLMFPSTSPRTMLSPFHAIDVMLPIPPWNRHQATIRHWQCPLNHDRPKSRSPSNKRKRAFLTSGGILDPSLIMFPSTMKWYNNPSWSVNTKCSLAVTLWGGCLFGSDLLRFAQVVFFFELKQ